MSHLYDQDLSPPDILTKPGHKGIDKSISEDLLPASAILHRDLHKKPHQVIEASGLYLTLSDRRRIIDATCGAAVSCIGHGDRRVRDAISAQITKLDCCHSLFFSCPSSEDLSRVLIDSTKGAMSRVFIVSSGSEAMDGAAKLARQYFLELSPPQPHRVRFIAREGSYHGNTLGALSISGHKARRSIYEPMLGSNVSHVSACNDYRGREQDETVPGYVDRLARELDREFQRVRPGKVCAFVAEPVVGAALGCVPSVPGYLKAMKMVCDKHGALLILDEVMCGMGRTGTAHAWQQDDVIPDIQTIGKGLGGGYVPIAGFLAGHYVIDVLNSGTGQFTHGQTCRAHPMVCAAALEVQRIIQQDDLVRNVARMGQALAAKLETTFTRHPNVGNIRGRGLFWALEFVESKVSKKPFHPALTVAMAIHEEGICQDPGIMLYPGVGCEDGWKGDHVIVSPPYTVTEEELDLIVTATYKAVSSVCQRIQGHHKEDT